MNMNIDSPSSAVIDVAPERVIEFPVGLAGFEDLCRYTLYHPETQAGALPNYFILQSLDDAEVSFTIADPALFGFNYEITLTDEESATIDLAEPGEAAVVVILVKENGQVRANLKAPLVINLRARRAIQHIFADLNFQVSAP
jgi:flagellar assembly factor FliW